uniref:Isoform 2 of Homologous recombination OB-fold protein n=1 Tax=Homo sapiens TaxID=9606 RepID=Q8N3J3-2|nr:unnamed protein product [Homo sapiens]
MACSLQKLFAVEEEFEDEDFLSAVEDAENRFTGSLPVNAGRLRPVSSRPQETVQAQSSRLLLLHPTAPSEALGLPDLDLCLPASSTPSADSRPSCIGAAPLRPVSTSNCLNSSHSATPLGSLSATLHCSSTSASPSC